MRYCTFLLLFWLTISTPLFADGLTRSIQEELRRRNLYFGEVDGRLTAELKAALKRYQARKELAITGEIDEDTANSLGVPVPISQKPPAERWPDVKVLKSDEAREISEKERVALEQQAAAAAEPSPAPPPPADQPNETQDLSPARIKKFVEDYLRDGETDDIEAQVAYYSFPVAYFDHGTVGREFVRRDTGNYVKRWPHRHYVLDEGSITFAAKDEDQTTVQFQITFTVKNKKSSVTGKTRNYWTIKAESPQTFKIVAIKEQRIRE